MPLPLPPTLDDNALGQLLNAFLSPYEPHLSEVAHKAGLSILQAAAWLAHPDTIELLNNLTIAFQARSKLLVSQALPHAIFGLADTAQYHHPRDPDANASVRARHLETARRASSRIIDLYQFESRRAEGPTSTRSPRRPAKPSPAPTGSHDHTPPNTHPDPPTNTREQTDEHEHQLDHENPTTQTPHVPPGNPPPPLAADTPTDTPTESPTSEVAPSEALTPKNVPGTCATTCTPHDTTCPRTSCTPTENPPSAGPRVSWHFP